MAKYLLIESRDPFEYGDVGYFCGIAGDLANADNEVTLFLIQNGVLMCRHGVNDNPLPPVAAGSSSVDVRADDFSLRERGISAGSMVSGVKSSNIDELVDLLVADDVKAVWH